MRNARAALASALLLGGCTHTKQLADIGFQPPEGSYRLIVMRPDVTVGLLTAGGAVEPREEWTTTARANILHAIEAQQAGRGRRSGKVVHNERRWFRSRNTLRPVTQA